MTWLVLTATAAAALIVLLLISRYRHHDVLRDWAGALHPGAAETLEQARENAALDQQMMDDAWSQAVLAQESERFQEAVRLLELAYWVLEDCTPARLERLRAMAYLCRKAAAVFPVEQVAPDSLETPRLAGLAWVAAIIHAGLVTPTERLAVRVRMLITGFQVLLWTLRRTKERAVARPERWAAWKAFGRLLRDWKTLDNAHLETLRVSLATLSNVLRGAV